MHHWIKRAFVAAAAPLLLTGCLWTPGKFNSDLTLRKDGSFVLNYRGEVVLQLPSESTAAAPWDNKMAHCTKEGEPEVVELPADESSSSEPDDETRPCTAAEIAQLKTKYEKEAAERAAAKQKENEEMAKAFGLPGFDDASNQAFAAKLMKYQGWRSVVYRGKGVFDIDYHFEGRATQDYVFPMMPETDLLIPFVAIRRRSDGTVLVTAPAMTGGTGPLSARGGAAMANAAKGGPTSRAEGRFTIITDGEILTNNREDGTAAHPLGRQVHWDVSATSSKIPETLIRLK
jgi:hypothetical protein